MLTISDVTNLRNVALDERTPAAKRLAAIDALAAGGNFYFTGHTKHLVTGYVAPTTRGRLFIGMALRKLLKSKRFVPGGMPQAIRSRLLFLKGVRLSNQLKRLDPPEGQPDKQVAKPVVKVPDVVRDIEAFLAKHK